MDTSRIQVSGQVTVDFQQRWIHAYLRPRPKRPLFCSLATPIGIEGDLEDCIILVAPQARI